MGIFCTGLVVVAGALFILKDDESGNKMNENAKKELVMNHDVKDESTKSFKLAVNNASKFSDNIGIKFPIIELSS